MKGTNSIANHIQSSRVNELWDYLKGPNPGCFLKRCYTSFSGDGTAGSQTFTSRKVLRAERFEMAKYIM